MDEAFLNAVDTEVLSVQRRLMAYAKKHPKIAARLRLGSDITSDPHVGRLVQAYAMLIARTRCRVEDAFPDIIEPLIELTAQPHLRSKPSLAIAELSVDPEQPPDVAGVTVPRGAELQTELINGRACQFKTCADIDFWPVQIDESAIDFPPFASTRSVASTATRALRLSLSTMAGNILPNELELDSLRFYIHDEPDFALRIYEALMCDVVGIQVVCDSFEKAWLAPDAISPAGYAQDERLLASEGQPDGERLMSEFVALPSRFFFFEITGLQTVLRQLEDTNFQLNILLGDVTADFPSRLPADAIKLGCVPVVNFFNAATEPSETNAVDSDVKLVVNSRDPESTQIHAIHELSFRHEDETEEVIAPFHGLGHDTPRSAESRYWEQNADDESRIRFVDLSGRAAAIGEGIVTAEVLCSNGNIPNQLPADDELPTLQPVTAGVVSTCRFVTRPTPWQPEMPIEFALRLVGRTLPHPGEVAASDQSNPAEMLRELLRLAFDDSENRFAQMTQSVADVRVRRVSGIHNHRMVCHGLELSVTLDDNRVLEGGMYLYADLLRRLFARYATRSTFVRYRVTTTSGRDYGLWPITEGERFNV